MNTNKINIGNEINIVKENGKTFIETANGERRFNVPMEMNPYQYLEYLQETDRIKTKIHIIVEEKDKYIIKTSAGTRYEVPAGIDPMKYYGLMQEVCSFIKEQGLTIQQAQKLCIDCSEMILEARYN